MPTNRPGYMREWRRRNAERMREYNRRRRWRTTNLLHLRARWRVADAVRSGRLVRPDECERCHRTPGRDALGRSLVHAHHEDHAEPLVVEWLCCTCHIDRHREQAA